MNFLSNFFKTIQNSVYSPKFYTGIPKKTFKQSFGYFLLLALVLTVINLIALIKPLFLEAPAQVKQFVQQIFNCYPKELEIKISSGQTSINQEEPYFISNCVTNTRERLVVIDTKTPYSAQKFDEYKVEAWLTKDSIFYKKNNLETRSYSLAEVKDFTLNQGRLQSYSNMISPWLNWIGPALLLLAFLGIYLTYVFRLIYLVFLALIIWALGKLFKQTLTFGNSYKIGLYTITLGLIVELIIALTSRWSAFGGFPFMVTIITLGVVWMNLFWPKRA